VSDPDQPVTDPDEGKEPVEEEKPETDGGSGEEKPPSTEGPTTPGGNTGGAEENSAGPDEQQNRVWVTEYRLDQVSITRAWGLGTESKYGNDIISVVDEGVDPVDGAELAAAAQELQDYYASMGTDLTPVDDGWDRVKGIEVSVGYRLVPVGGHYEYYDNEEELAEIYAHGDSALTDEQRQQNGTIFNQTYTFTTSDGQTFTSKKQAVDYCTNNDATIADVKLDNSQALNGYIRTQTVDEMVVNAGGEMGSAWCLEGETILDK
jgi:hypothetical protein